MIAVDTNLLVRLVMNDDENQVAAGLRVLQGGEPVLLLNSVLLETAWVLKAVYSIPPAAIAAALKQVLDIPSVIPESPETRLALAWHLDGMDFADAIHLAGAAARCKKLATFDAAFVRRSQGKTACEVFRPG